MTANPMPLSGYGNLQLVSRSDTDGFFMEYNLKPKYLFLKIKNSIRNLTFKLHKSLRLYLLYQTLD